MNELLRGAPNRWREVVRLAGAKAAHGTASAAWTLAEALCFADPSPHQDTDDGDYWGALLAAQVLIENRSVEQVAVRHRPKVERIRTWLTSAHCSVALCHQPIVPRLAKRWR